MQQVEDETARRRPWKAVILISAGVVALLVAVAWLVYRRYAPLYDRIQDVKNVTLCKSNLFSLGVAFQMYQQRFKSYPRTRSGCAFLLAPLKRGLFERSEETILSTYVCPGDDIALQILGEDVLEAYGDLANIDPAVISYAGRNTVDFPLDREKAGQEPIACDAGGTNGDLLNHRGRINVLFLDGHLESLDVSVLPGGEKGFKVGPNAPHPWLRVLNKDP
jgi:prepilin-type processing-associated H-X9-DG protein